MSKITALITVLALGASAPVAMASSSAPYDRHTTLERSRVDRARIARSQDRFEREGRAGRGWERPGVADDFGPRRYRPTWTAFGAPLSLTRRADDSIEVHDGGTFTQLRLATLGGAARVDRVLVQFADGSNQVEELHRTLDGSQAYVEIPLDGNNRQIRCITVIGTTGARSNLQVYGI